MPRVYRRKRGDTLQPGRFTPAVVSALKMKTREWDGQYQQTPTPATGRIFNPQWWRYYKSRDLPEVELVTLSVDCSFKGTASSDYVSIQKWGQLGVRSYLIDRRTDHMGFVQTVQAIKQMQRDGRPASCILVEDKANGSAVIESLQADPDFGSCVIAVNPQGDKVSRANAASVEVEAGSVYLPEDADYVSALVRTLATFPAVKHDDDVDALSQFINWRRSRNLSYGVLDYVRKIKTEIASGIRDAWGQLIHPKPPKPKPVATPAPTRITVNNFDAQRKPNLVCPNCQSTATGPLGSPGNIHCNQCSADFLMSGEIVRKPAPRERPGHIHHWRAIAGGKRCDDCGEQQMEFQPLGMTFDLYRSGKYRRGGWR